MAKKLKITRKQMKQPDDFLTRTEQVWDWAEKHTWQAVGILAGVAALFLLIQAGGALLRSSGDTPSNDLGNAIQTLKAPIAQDQTIPGQNGSSFQSDKEKYGAALEPLNELISKYPETTEGQMALLYMAQAKAKLGDNNSAMDSYKKFLSTKIAADEPVLKISALMGVAKTSFDAGQFQEALDYYNQVMASDSPMKPAAMMGAARCEYKLGHEDKAGETLAMTQKEFPDAWITQSSDFLPGYWKEKAEEKKAADLGKELSIQETPQTSSEPVSGNTGE
jgi:tetratricopeptide (TPR) repeat protein